MRRGVNAASVKSGGIYYTINQKKHAYPEKIRKLAIKMYYGGVSGRGVGKILGMNKSNVMNWIKKSAKIDVEKCKIGEEKFNIIELDELYWFLGYRSRTKTRENVYSMTMVSREPRQIVGHVVSRDKMSSTIQQMVDTTPEAKQYCTDGYYRISRCSLSGKTYL